MKPLIYVAFVALLTTGTAMGASRAAVLGPTVVMPGEVFEIQVELQSPDNLMVGWFIDGIMATNGAMVGPVTGGTAAEQAAYHYANTCGWDTSSANVLLGWVSQTAFPVGPMVGVPVGDGGTNGVAFRMAVVAPSPYPWEPYFDIFVTGGVYGDPETFADTAFEECPVLRVYIPEPAGVLLLLVGLAMSRRKRRA